MFVNCKHCHSLVATDPVTDLPPVHCPRCHGVLRDEAPASTDDDPFSTLPASTADVLDDRAQTPQETQAIDVEGTADATAAIKGAEEGPVGAAHEFASAVETEADSGTPADNNIPPPGGPMADAITTAHPTTPPIAKREWTLVGWLAGKLRRRQAAPVAMPIEHAPEAAGDGLSSQESETIDVVDRADGLATAIAVEATGIADSVPATTLADAATVEPTAPAATLAEPAIDPPAQGSPAVEFVIEDAPGSTDDPAIPNVPIAPGADAVEQIIAATPVAPTLAPVQGKPQKPAPSFARSGAITPADTPRARWILAATIATLSLLLGLQILLADRARLAADARWRPLVTTLCGTFGCDVPAWREPEAWTLLSLDVRPHPSRAGALRASATLRNDARWPQAWPELVLTLSDIDGRTLGARAFTADEYLGGMVGEQTLASGRSAMVRVDLLEPAGAAISYSLDVR